jgi:hypothetical protein
VLRAAAAAAVALLPVQRLAACAKMATDTIICWVSGYVCYAEVWNVK